MNFKYKGYNRLFVDELPDCRLYNKWLKRIIKNKMITI